MMPLHLCLIAVMHFILESVSLPSSVSSWYKMLLLALLTGARKSEHIWTPFTGSPYILRLFYLVLNGLAPPYLSELLHLSVPASGHQTRRYWRWRSRATLYPSLKFGLKTHFYSLSFDSALFLCFIVFTVFMFLIQYIVLTFFLFIFGEGPF